MSLAGGIGLAAQIPTWPSLPAGNVTPALTATLLDAASEYCGMVLQAPQAGTIKKVVFLTGTVSTGATLNVTIEGVDTSTGGPDGTPLTNGSTTCVVADTDDNVQKTATFTTGPTLTEGQLIAVRIANPAASFGNLNLNISTSTLTSAYLPYSFTGLPSLSKSRNAPLIGLEYSDGSYAYFPYVFPVLTFSTESSFSASTTPDEIGLKFSLPFPYRVRGCWWQASAVGSQTLTVTLYDSDGSTVLEAVTVDSEQVQTTSSGGKFIYFTNRYDLAKNMSYRLTLKPGVSNVSLGGFTVTSAAQMDAFEGGQSFHRTERTDSGAWTDTTTARPWMGLIVSAFDDGTATAGAAPRPQLHIGGI